MFKTLARKYTAWRLRRIAIERLRHMDDRMLADMGTERDSIVDFVMGQDCP